MKKISVFLKFGCVLSVWMALYSLAGAQTLVGMDTVITVTEAKEIAVKNNNGVEEYDGFESIAQFYYLELYNDSRDQKIGNLVCNSLVGIETGVNFSDVYYFQNNQKCAAVYKMALNLKGTGKKLKFSLSAGKITKVQLLSVTP